MKDDTLSTDDAVTPALPETDPVAMAAAFEEFFQHEYPGLGLRVQQCRVTRVYQKPGKACLIAYRVQGHDHHGRPFDQWLHGRLQRNGAVAGGGESATPSWSAGDFWKPVSLWPERRMVVHAFPHDPKLPQLARLKDAGFIRQNVERNLAEFGLSGAWHCTEVFDHKVKYMPGKRCVLRYRVSLRHAAGEQQTRTFYSKTTDDASGRTVAAALRVICASRACAAGVLNVPAPIAYLPEIKTLWQHAWEGESLTRRCAERGWATLAHAPVLPKIAAMLAALHQIELPAELQRPGASPATMLTNARDNAAQILKFLPEVRERQAHLLQKMAATLPRSAAGTPRTTIHGTFKLAQILVREEQPGLVDFDALAVGDPLYDVAEFLASVIYLRVSDGVAAASITAAVALFVGSYAGLVPWPCERRRLAWYVTAFLLGKMHSSLKRMEREARQQVVAAFALLEELLESPAGL